MAERESLRRLIRGGMTCCQNTNAASYGRRRRRGEGQRAGRHSGSRRLLLFSDPALLPNNGVGDSDRVDFSREADPRQQQETIRQETRRGLDRREENYEGFDDACGSSSNNHSSQSIVVDRSMVEYFSWSLALSVLHAASCCTFAFMTESRHPRQTQQPSTCSPRHCNAETSCQTQCPAREEPRRPKQQRASSPSLVHNG